MSISVVIADDQAMVRAGFRSLLVREPDIEVLGEAADGVAAVRRFRRDHRASPGDVRRAGQVAVALWRPGMDDFLATAAEVLGASEEQLGRLTGLALAESALAALVRRLW